MKITLFLHSFKNNYCKLFSLLFLSIMLTNTPHILIGKCTVLVYVAARNNLDYFAPLDIKEMQSVGSNDQVNVLVCLNRLDANGKPTTQNIRIAKGTAFQDGPTLALDSGAEGTLTQALTWAHTKYPSDQFVLILWNHGSGPLNRSGLEHHLRGICYDDFTGHYLTEKDVITSLNTVMQKYRNNKKIDILAFDACLMSHLELGVTFAPFANYMVASQETIPGAGYQYASLLSIFTSNKPVLTIDLAKWMVSCYGANYNALQENSYTLAALDLNKIDAPNKAHNALAVLLTQFLTQSMRVQVAQAINRAVAKCIHFTYPEYIDLATFYNNMLTEIPSMKLSSTQATTLKAALSNCQSALQSCVLSKVYSAPYAQTGGLSVYFPVAKRIEPSYVKLAWALENKWLTFLQSLVKI